MATEGDRQRGASACGETHAECRTVDRSHLLSDCDAGRVMFAIGAHLHLHGAGGRRPYVCRSAVTGSRRIARMAGTVAATIARPSSTSGTPANVIGSNAPTPNS